MNKEQLDRLKTDIKYLGFGDTSTELYTDLEEQVAKGAVGFDLYTEGFFDDDTRMEAILYFDLSKDLTRYIFKRYEAKLHYTNDPARTSSRSQTIYLYKGKGFTFKETFNLLQGRAVNKDRIDLDGHEYNAWCQLNFDEKDKFGDYKIREFRKEWHYDLEAALQAYPITDLKNDEVKQNLIRALKRGNAHPVTLLKGRKLERVFIEACPSTRLLIFRSQATRVAFDYKKEGDAGTPVTGLPDTPTPGSGPGKGQELLPFEVKKSDQTSDERSDEVEGTEEPEEELQTAEAQSQPSPRSSHRKRVYK
ncbi:MAG TPA: hypothetical protein VGN00_22860 [Puia sp.]|jgi:hypothetical protein